MVLAHCLAAFEPSLYARSALAVVELIKKADKSTVTQVSVFEELAQRFLLQVRVLVGRPPRLVTFFPAKKRLVPLFCTSS